MVNAQADDRASPYMIAYLANLDGYWQVEVMTAGGEGQRQLTHNAYDKMHLSGYLNDRQVLVNGLQGELVRVDSDTGQEQAIHYSGPMVADAAISPDGTMIAFTTNSGDINDNNDIWIMRADGTKPQRLTAIPNMQIEPAWSADGQWIYFSSGKGGVSHDIWRVSIDGSQSEAISSAGLYHFDVAVATDGRLAFSNNRTGDYDIYVRMPDGKTQAVAPQAGLDAHPSWSPDGRQLLFDSLRGGVVNIWRYDFTSKQLTQLTHSKDGARFPVWLQKEVRP